MTPTSTTEAAPPAVAEITRTFAAPRALVFEAFSRPELLKRWMGPREYPVTTCLVDFRPGGEFVLGMTGPDGAEHRSTSTYHEIAPPERIVWTSAFAGGPPDQVHTVVTFEDLGPQTRVHVRQTFRVLTPETAPFAAGMQEGWNQAIEHLDVLLGAEVKPGGAVRYRHQLEILSDTEVRITRDFAAPARLVYRATTEPRLLARWYGCAFMKMTVNEADVRPGGEFRRTLELPDGTECAFKGRFLEIDPPHRAVYTENFLLGDTWTDDLTYHVNLAEHDGVTTVTMRLVYANRWHRDGHLGANMEVGMAESHQRLDQVLAALAPAPAGTLCWDELVTVDPAAARTFYGALLGWEFEDVPYPGRQPLGVAKANGRRVASIRHLPAEHVKEGDRPGGWLPFVATEDVDAATERARQLGGEPLTEAHAMPDLGGRVAVIKDPTGPVIALWDGPASELSHGEPGSACWHDTYPADGARARAFYGELLGWEADTFEMMGMEVNTYARAKGEEPQAFSCDAGAEGYWQPFFAVEDVDGLAKKAQELGGTAKFVMSTPTGGRFAHLIDPQGAPFGIMNGKAPDPDAMKTM